MSDTPVLSYKKPSSASSRQQSSTPSHPSSPLPKSQFESPRISSATTSRQVSSRRKALQDFYNIHHQESQDTNIEESISSSETTNNVNFNDPEQLLKFMKSTPVEEILKLRNSITNKLNSHDSAKKSIIYDNYYELIKLSQILGDLSKPKPVAKENTLDGLGIFTNPPNELKTKTKEINDHDLDSIFTDLSKFINEDVQQFNTEFETVVKSLQKDFDNDDNDSASSMKGIAENSEKDKFPESINKQQLVKEVNLLLDEDPKNVKQESKNKILNDIQDILKSLNVHHDELLILQLNKLKSKFT
ncbi:DEHA2A06226p [Debaryomyces hansenii CBS767]|uniref:DEHA2A06226p n=1 Tax=Debaryomyces hansenii (strain ATCC 36239 / CBS 767 / BCRC 21394 / JCM 1990 / NBRC 0083 / IGC 2968) TaxID=284592 RepID=Q6BYX5_DEBHA|nr:DEHA2A06226p [Debaryomyces hansenii CBS767]CAG84550.2 DEHA2A06226p [Debaryomyces hansenii CBS767]|eukprot:XP_456594.2 DEHA2A06226p [Debaryomyces hansenii CBS767]